MDARLERFYGKVPARPKRDPIGELVLTILSQNTSDRNSLAAEKALLEALPSWEAVASAPQEVIERAIRPGGLSNLKAARIKAVLGEVRRREGELSLERLRDLPLEAALDYLVSLAGVGPKTAACVALFSLGLPAFPVDTHVRRIAARLGLIPPTADLVEAHRLLSGAVEPGRRYQFHVHLIDLGREICQARRPCCEVCPLAAVCAHAELAGEVPTRKRSRSAAPDRA